MTYARACKDVLLEELSNDALSQAFSFVHCSNKVDHKGWIEANEQGRIEMLPSVRKFAFCDRSGVLQIGIVSNTSMYADDGTGQRRRFVIASIGPNLLQMSPARFPVSEFTGSFLGFLPNDADDSWSAVLDVIKTRPNRDDVPRTMHSTNAIVAERFAAIPIVVPIGNDANPLARRVVQEWFESITVLKDQNKSLGLGLALDNIPTDPSRPFSHRSVHACYEILPTDTSEYDATLAFMERLSNEIAEQYIKESDDEELKAKCRTRHESRGRCGSVCRVSRAKFELILKLLGASFPDNPPCLELELAAASDGAIELFGMTLNDAIGWFQDTIKQYSSAIHLPKGITSKDIVVPQEAIENFMKGTLYDHSTARTGLSFLLFLVGGKKRTRDGAHPSYTHTQVADAVMSQIIFLEACFRSSSHQLYLRVLHYIYASMHIDDTKEWMNERAKKDQTFFFRFLGLLDDLSSFFMEFATNARNINAVASGEIMLVDNTYLSAFFRQVHVLREVLTQHPSDFSFSTEVTAILGAVAENGVDTPRTLLTKLANDLNSVDCGFLKTDLDGDFTNLSNGNMLCRSYVSTTESCDDKTCSNEHIHYHHLSWDDKNIVKEWMHENMNNENDWDFSKTI